VGNRSTVAELIILLFKPDNKRMIMRPFDNIGIVLNDNPIEPRHAKMNMEPTILKVRRSYDCKNIIKSHSIKSTSRNILQEIQSRKIQL
jgi:hypothetical protein